MIVYNNFLIWKRHSVSTWNVKLSKPQLKKDDSGTLLVSDRMIVERFCNQTARLNPSNILGIIDV